MLVDDEELRLVETFEQVLWHIGPIKLSPLRNEYERVDCVLRKP
jgi:hypothetical protein